MLKPTRNRAAKLLDEVVSEISKEEGISIKRVDIILQSIFSQIAKDFREGTLKETRILHLGKFYVKPYKMQRHLNKLNDKNESNIENKG